jgi:hypothetical protein
VHTRKARRKDRELECVTLIHDIHDPYYYQDHKTGTGIPDQATADSILRNPHYGSNFSPGVYGFKNFFVNSNETSYDEWDTITV